ncbi:FtsK/SpoIIIE domain-containing protein [Streptomyces sp. NRRL F-5123]|uniref:FtsK/SpoIIIE domain-containing protein n=1 Tax=Streptomyces sp. NRRL F-5123 TaxID=1463856 RepID=UPI0004E235B2|nr:FtsK/SpoIIIE domain-containing protein [Streptomyces sp. NRRL F-5123]
MQIRLTVLGPRSGRAARGSDVLVTAPAGTVLGSVAGALASAAGSGQPGRSAGASVALYAGQERVPPTAVLGVPPLVDGAVLALHAPAGPHDPGPYGSFGEYGSPAAGAARLLVVGGPDAGGVHLLPGGRATIGRSADADVPLDDPDVSRLHCEVTFGPDGTPTVADLGSTNGTTLDGRAVGPQPVPLPPGALLQLGESTLRLDPPGAPAPHHLPAAPDAEGHLRVGLRDSGPEPEAVSAAGAAGPRTYAHAPAAPAAATGPTAYGHGTFRPAAPPRPPAEGPAETATAYGDAAEGPSAYGRRDTGQARRPGVGGGRGGVVGSIGAWARRRLQGAGRAETAEEYAGAEAAALRERWPDPAAVLLTALGPGRRLWERGPGHPDALTVRLGTTGCGPRQPAGVPFAVALRDPHSAALTLAGPRPRLAGLARAVLAQLCALHSPGTLEVVLLSADRTRPADQRTEEWAWLNWLPHLRPAHGQDCRLLLAFDREQAQARTAELVRRIEESAGSATGPAATAQVARTAEASGSVAGAPGGAAGAAWAAGVAGTAGSAATARAASGAGPAEAVGLAGAAGPTADAGAAGAYVLLVVDGDPGSAALRETVARIAAAGPAAGVHVLCLAEPGERPAVDTGVVARLSGDVATTLRVEPAGGPADTDGRDEADDADEIVLDAVSAAWAEHFARALAPLREADAEAYGAGSRHALPAAVRLLDELDLALATPAKIAARWAAAHPAVPAAGAVLGAGAGAGADGGRVAVDLVAEGPHLLVGGAPGAGKTELLRSVAAALAAGERPERLALVLLDGGGQERGEGLAACADLPHVTEHLVANDPVRMREFAQALGAELKRRAAVLGEQTFAAWHAERVVTASVPRQGGRRPADAADVPDAPEVPSMPRLVLLVDDLDALVAPALGSPGRPAAGSVVRAVEAIARDGERLGVHLVAATGRPERTAGTDADERAPLRIALRSADPESAALLVGVEDPAGFDEAVPGRGYLRRPGGAVTAFQAGRVSGRIPRTATLRPTVVALEWERMGDPPARRQVRELGNGPTDLALLASALQRASEAAPLSS